MAMTTTTATPKSRQVRAAVSVTRQVLRMLGLVFRPRSPREMAGDVAWWARQARR